MWRCWLFILFLTGVAFFFCFFFLLLVSFSAAPAWCITAQKPGAGHKPKKKGYGSSRAPHAVHPSATGKRNRRPTAQFLLAASRKPS